MWFENNLHRLRMDFLSIGFCKQTNIKIENDNVFHLATCKERKDRKGLK